MMSWWHCVSPSFVWWLLYCSAWDTLIFFFYEEPSCEYLHSSIMIWGFVSLEKLLESGIASSEARSFFHSSCDSPSCELGFITPRFSRKLLWVYCCVLVLEVVERHGMSKCRYVCAKEVLRRKQPWGREGIGRGETEGGGKVGVGEIWEKRQRSLGWKTMVCRREFLLRDHMVALRV